MGLTVEGFQKSLAVSLPRWGLDTFCIVCRCQIADFGGSFFTADAWVHALELINANKFDGKSVYTWQPWNSFHQTSRHWWLSSRRWQVESRFWVYLIRNQLAKTKIKQEVHVAGATAVANVSRIIWEDDINTYSPGCSYQLNNCFSVRSYRGKKYLSYFPHWCFIWIGWWYRRCHGWERWSRQQWCCYSRCRDPEMVQHIYRMTGVWWDPRCFCLEIYFCAIWRCSSLLELYSCYTNQ